MSASRLTPGARFAPFNWHFVTQFWSPLGEVPLILELAASLQPMEPGIRIAVYDDGAYEARAFTPGVTDRVAIKMAFRRGTHDS